MRVRNAALMITSALAVLVLAGICLAQEPGEFCGTWVNEGYDYSFAGLCWAKSVFKPDGTVEHYVMAGDTENPMRTGRYTVEDKWTDSEGNAWFKQTVTFAGSEGESVFTLLKVNKSRSILEYAADRNEYPAELNPRHGNYRVYYRK